jgi:hypothetical protein
MSTSIRNRLAGNIEKWFPTKLCLNLSFKPQPEPNIDYYNWFVQRMNLKEGDTVFAIIKTTEVSVEKR